MSSFLSLFFGCGHNRTTFPLTPSRRGAIAGSSYAGQPKRHNTYVVCLDCGKEFDYNWKEMRVGSPVQGESTQEAPKAAAVAANR